MDTSLPASRKQEAVLNAQLIVDAFNLMGCDAVGIGEGELRLGVQEFAAAGKKAAFPFISANVVLPDGRKASIPSVVKSAGGLRWGVFGLMSANPTPPPAPRNWQVLDPVGTGKQVIEELQGKADIIILLAAMPLDELKAVLAQVPGVMIAVLGNDPAGLALPIQVGKTLVVGSAGYGRSLGMLHLPLRNLGAPFVDEVMIRDVEQRLAGVERRIQQGGAGALREEQARLKGELKALQKGNICHNERIMLSSQSQGDQGVQQLIDAFKARQEKLGTGCP